MAEQLRVAIALDTQVDRSLVQTVFPKDGPLELVAVGDVYDSGAAAMAESHADVVVVACHAGHGDDDPVVPFIETVAGQRRTRPVLVLVTGSPNGFVRRAFEAGAGDILSLDPSTRPEQVAFAVEKVVARTGSSAAAGDLGGMITVVGPKGGVGKTLVSCNLAAALAAAGESVALVDLDLQFGDVGLAMGMSPTRTVYDLATSGGSLDPVKLDAYLGRHASGVRTLLAPLRPEQATSVGPDFLRDVYTTLRTAFSHVVVDTPPHLTPEVVGAIEASTQVCIVGMLDSLALKTTKVTLEALERMGYDDDRLVFVLNRADSRVGITPADVATIVGRRPDVLLPSSRDIACAVNDGEPIVASQPRSEGAKVFASLANRYATGASAAPAPRAQPREKGGRRLLRRTKAA